MKTQSKQGGRATRGQAPIECKVTVLRNKPGSIGIEMNMHNENRRNLQIKKGTGGLRLNGLAKSSNYSFGAGNGVIDKAPFEINTLRSSISGCQRRLFSLTTPFKWLNDEPFQLRCWLGMERMSCVELASRRDTLLRLNLAVLAILLIGLVCLTSGSGNSNSSSSNGSSSSSSSDSSAKQRVRNVERTVVTNTPTSPEPDPFIEAETPVRLYQAPFILPEPSTAKSAQKTNDAEKTAPSAPPPMTPGEDSEAQHY